MAHLSMQYMRFQSTPSAWRETEFTLHGKEYEGISIHSLRMEGDVYRQKQTKGEYNFNPLPPHGGRHFLGLCVPR